MTCPYCGAPMELGNRGWHYYCTGRCIYYITITHNQKLAMRKSDDDRFTISLFDTGIREAICV